MWLHLTHDGSSRREDEDDEEDAQTEPDGLSEESTPRACQFYPALLKPYVFSGHNSELGLPLSVGTALGCILSMWWVYQVEELSVRSFTKRLMLLLAGALGAVLGAGSGVYLQQCWSARKDVEEGDSNMDIITGEMKAAGFDIMSPAMPSTPHSVPTPAQSLRDRNFEIEKQHPGLGLRQRYVHGEI